MNAKDDGRLVDCILDCMLALLLCCDSCQNSRSDGARTLPHSQAKEERVYTDRRVGSVASLTRE